MSKISGPLLDRIEIHIDVPAVRYKELRAGASPEGSGHSRERVVHARERQPQRFSRARLPIWTERTTSMHALAVRGEIAIRSDLSRRHPSVFSRWNHLADYDTSRRQFQYRTLDRTYWA